MDDLKYLEASGFETTKIEEDSVIEILPNGEEGRRVKIEELDITSIERELAISSSVQSVEAMFASHISTLLMLASMVDGQKKKTTVAGIEAQNNMNTILMFASIAKYGELSAEDKETIDRAIPFITSLSALTDSLIDKALKGEDISEQLRIAEGISLEKEDLTEQKLNELKKMFNF